MTNVHLPQVSQWGYCAQSATPAEIIQALVQETHKAILKYDVLHEGPECCDDRNGYSRVSVEIRLPPTLVDQLMNGPTGYRAHYSASVNVGEDFNHCLVEAVAPMVVNAESLYADKFDSVFCKRSLLGPYSKFWYPKALTDPSAESHLRTLKEELQNPRWVTYWRTFQPPRKGLLVPESMAVLLNGTFVNGAGDAYEQKPDRSKQLFETGWT
jgi:hypothetical protein